MLVDNDLREPTGVPFLPVWLAPEWQYQNGLQYHQDVEVKSMGRDDVLALLTAHRGEIERFGVESLRLFGSVARGEAAADSDVDLLVSFRASPTFSAYMKLRIFLEDLLGVQVDLITESGLREGVRPFVEKDAIRVA